MREDEGSLDRVKTGNRQIDEAGKKQHKVEGLILSCAMKTVNVGKGLPLYLSESLQVPPKP